MCGILGVISGSKNGGKNDKNILRDLFLLSESRGKEASGVAVRHGDDIHVLKAASPASVLIQSEKYRGLLGGAWFQAIGHARLVTDGSSESNANNQPIIKDGIITIHNGIIVNHNELWAQFPDIVRTSEVDTEIINSLTRHFIRSGHTHADAVSYVFGLIRGEATVAIMFEDIRQVLFATNTGSLYYQKTDQGVVVASERYILQQACLAAGLEENIQQLKAGTAFFVDSDGCVTVFSLSDSPHDFQFDAGLASIRDISAPDTTSQKKDGERRQFTTDVLPFELTRRGVKRLQRCVRCILPETMPFIDFDESGVCTYCRHYTPITVLGRRELERTLLDQHATSSGGCILPFSGGRDSSYALHILVKEFGIKPTAFSYDWGMVTDLGRRNQARLCGALGVEHIWLSADIGGKRRNIRKNVTAWLRRPTLGTIPLFMAGDKQYFYYANQLRKRMGAGLVVYGENLLEKTDFKSGFAGVPPKFGITHAYNLGLMSKLKLAAYYGSEFLRNPSLMNSSLIDTASAFISSYILPHDYLHLFRYLDWNEATVNSVLRREYDWELAPDTKSTWRIGDGTAPFYNYIYYTVAGFTENDTFRSNQIREGQITREEALALAERDNMPRWDSMRWYFDTIGIDAADALSVIHAIPKLFTV